MMKKLYILLFACFLLIGCGNKTEQSSNQPKETKLASNTKNEKKENSNAENIKEDTPAPVEVVIENISVDEVHLLADQEVQRLTSMLDPQKMKGSNTPGDYPIEMVTKINIIPDEYPEILLLDQINGVSQIEIFRFNTSVNGWVSIYKDDKHVNYDGLEPLMYLGYGEFGEVKKQYPAFGHWTGSGGFFNFQFLNSDDIGQIKISLDKMEANYPAGDIFIEDKVEKKIDIKSNGEVIETFTSENLK